MQGLRTLSEDLDKVRDALVSKDGIVPPDQKPSFTDFVRQTIESKQSQLVRMKTSVAAQI